MAQQQGIEANKPVTDVIKDLLLSMLPAELHAAAPELADHVAEHPYVQARVHKRWGELSEQGNIIAREVGLIARDVVLGAGSVTQFGGEHLH